MKIIHTGDIHLDSKLNTKLSGHKITERRNELLKAFKKMVDYADKNDVRVIIIAGDFFDAATAMFVIMEYVFEIIKQYNKIDFLYLSGNHDENLIVMNNKVLPKNLKVFGTSWTTYNYENISITGVQLNKDNYQNIYDELKLNNLHTNIVVLHGEITNSTKFTSVEMIPQKLLTNKNIDYLALGHIHSHAGNQQLDERGVYAYCGCLEGRDFGETGDKGFVLLDIENDKITSTFVKNSIRTVREFVLNVENLNTNLQLENAIAKMLKDISKDDIVRIVLSGSVSTQWFIDTKKIEQHFEMDYYYFEVKNNTTLEINPQDYQNDVSIKSEFINQVISGEKAGQLQDDIIKTGLLVLLGQEVQL